MWFDALVNMENNNSLAHHNTEQGPSLGEGPRRSVRAEFKVKLKRTKALYAKRDQNKLHREPVLRQYLVLAYQAKRAIESQRGRTSKEISEWIGYTPARMSQIMSLLFLCPFIQEDILLSDKPYLHKLTINQANLIARELLWDTQRDMWIKISPLVK